MSAVITTQIRQVGPYTLESRLATGGQATVYLAHDGAPGAKGATTVVVKTPTPNGERPGTKRALLRERLALASIDHPHVVRLLDHDLHADPPYLVLEYVRGMDLHRLMRLSSPSGTGIPEDLACFLCYGVASALGSLHGPADTRAPRVFHGDVSPSNILLSERGDVKLSDFGLARCSGGAPSSERRPTFPPVPETVWGHRGYLAPERVDGAPASAESDVFALAVVLSELLTGGPAFPGDGELARLISMKEGRFSPALDDSAHVSPKLLELCRRGLSPQPDRRPAALEVADVLQAHLRSDAGNEAKLARSLSTWVSWAEQQSRTSTLTDERLCDSVRVLRASCAISGLAPRAKVEPNAALLRPADGGDARRLSYSELVSLAASGQLDRRDAVALFGTTFEAVANIPALARHLAPCSAALTSEVSPLGPPDYCEQLGETSLSQLLGRLVAKKATGLLVVERSSGSRNDRKDVYLQEGRVTHVSSTEGNDRLGESLIQAQVLTRQELSAAVRHMVKNQGQLGESLVALKFVDPVVVYHALCVQGRDRIVQLCTWTRGRASFYSGVCRPEVAFPLDVDLHVCLVHAVDLAKTPPPAPQLRVVALQGCPAPRSAPTSLPLLNLVPSIARKRLTVATALSELSLLSARGVTTNPASYLVVARALGWINFV